MNDLYVILLAVPYSMEADEDIITATKIIAGVYKSHIEDKDIPEEIDEYILAGFLRKKSVKLVKCISNDIYVPEDVDFVLEGYSVVELKEW